MPLSTILPLPTVPLLAEPSPSCRVPELMVVVPAMLLPRFVRVSVPVPIFTRPLVAVAALVMGPENVVPALVPPTVSWLMSRLTLPAPANEPITRFAWVAPARSWKADEGAAGDLNVGEESKAAAALEVGDDDVVHPRRQGDRPRADGDALREVVVHHLVAVDE